MVDLCKIIININQHCTVIKYIKHMFYQLNILTYLLMYSMYWMCCQPQLQLHVSPDVQVPILHLCPSYFNT